MDVYRSAQIIGPLYYRYNPTIIHPHAAMRGTFRASWETIHVTIYFHMEMLCAPYKIDTICFAVFFALTWFIEELCCRIYAMYQYYVHPSIHLAI